MPRAKGGRGAGFGVGGGGLTQPPSNFSKFLVFFFGWLVGCFLGVFFGYRSLQVFTHSG